MTNMIGKISGVDWSTAPVGATHLKLYKNGAEYWYKFEDAMAYFFFLLLMMVGVTIVNIEMIALNLYQKKRISE